jgi:hypothetical protein
VTLILCIYSGETQCSGPLSPVDIQATTLFHYGIPFNKGRGLRGSRSARSEPQRAWDSFLLASSVLEASTGGTGLCFGEGVDASRWKLGWREVHLKEVCLGVHPHRSGHHREEGGLGKIWEKGRKTAPQLS